MTHFFVVYFGFRWTFPLESEEGERGSATRPATETRLPARSSGPLDVRRRPCLLLVGLLTDIGSRRPPRVYRSIRSPKFFAKRCRCWKNGGRSGTAAAFSAGADLSFSAIFQRDLFD